MYGYPAEEGMKAAERGEISLGGCVIYDDSPTMRCSDCGHSWGRLGG